MIKTENTSTNNRREIFGWIVYDWANSVFFTTVVGVLIGEYLTALAQQAVGENGIVLSTGLFDVTAKSMYPYTVGLSVFLQIFFLPILGAIADYSHLKKSFMAFFCFLGAIACGLLFFIDGNLYLLGCFIFLAANLSAGASMVFYNSYLNDITTIDRRDKVSSFGFAAGYVSGALMLFANLMLLKNAESLGLSTNLAVRICLLTAGVWWGVFALVTFALLKRRKPVRDVPRGKNYFSAGIGELRDTFRELFKLKHTLLFLIAYLLYNDGIQTVITTSSTFISQELFVRNNIETDRSVLVVAFLIAQIVGFIGALTFERIARLTSTKYSIMISLVIWSAIVIYAYAFLSTVSEAYIMSGFIGFVLGGSQALSRSLFSQMIPAGRESAFFGIYEISERGTSWIGPVVFGVVAQVTNSYRPAILALIVFFIAGLVILFFTNTKKAIEEAGNDLPARAALKI
ncbi:MAG: major facilitator superfamily 1 [Acidobacteria bacterium]|jgi:UMF1 family MFS transporter|nr:major facilitator superfamily 1 [Acidobacteriota bacterium]